MPQDSTRPSFDTSDSSERASDAALFNERITPEQMAAAALEAQAHRQEAARAPQAEDSQAAENAAFRLPVPIPASLITVGCAMLIGFFADLSESLPPEVSNLLWQTAVLERFFNTGVVSLLGMTLILSGFWLSDAADSEKRPLRSGVAGVLAFGMGLAFLLSLPLYYQTTSRVSQLRLNELTNQRTAQNPLPGSPLADQYDRATTEINRLRQRKLVRFGLNGAGVGGALLLVGIFGIRYARKRAGVGYACPRCQSVEVKPAKMDRDEASLALFTRIHTFSCRRCGFRFRRFSLTGKPYPFFF